MKFLANEMNEMVQQAAEKIKLRLAQADNGCNRRSCEGPTEMKSKNYEKHLQAIQNGPPALQLWLSHHIPEEIIGFVIIDSGQLLMLDPCYIGDDAQESVSVSLADFGGDGTYLVTQHSQKVTIHFDLPLPTTEELEDWLEDE